ncbi:MAG: hypothetical protein NTX59_02455 [Elusimicrobia bacterium]|nr:hypothetical protein [Elusimicrobiota bacterium]
MKKLVKISLWTGGVLAALALAGALALKIYFTPERVKRLALDYASSNLKREIDFKSASVNLSGFSVAGLRVSEYPDFSKGEFLSAEAVSVRPSLRELIFSGKIKVRSVSADGLKLKVMEIKKDTYNFSDLLSAKGNAGPPAARKSSAAPAPLGISKLSVKNSRFSYRNFAGDMAVTIKDITLDAKNISPDTLFPLEANFTLDIAMPAFKGSMPVYLKGRAALGGWDPQKGRAEIEHARLSLGALKLEFSGKLSNLMEPEAELKLALKSFSTSDLKPFFPAAPGGIIVPATDADTAFKMTFNDLRLNSLTFKAGPASGALKGALAWNPLFDYSFNAELKAQIPEMDSSELSKQFPMVPAGFKIPLTDIKVSAAIKPSAADIRSFEAHTKGMDLSGSAAIKLAPAMQATVKLKAEITDLSRLSKLATALEPYALIGRAGADLSCGWTGALSVSGRADFSGVGAGAAGRKLSGLKGALDFSKDMIVSGPLSGKLDGEDFKGSFSVKNYTSHPKAVFDFKLAKFAMKDLPAASGGGKDAKKPPQKPDAQPFYVDLAGAAEVGAIEHPNFSAKAAAFKCDLKNISPDLKELSGVAAFNVGAGKLSELYELAKNNKAAKVALYPLIVLQKASKLAKGARLPDFNNIAFDKIEGDYLFDKGVMKINKSLLTAAVADVSSSGSINLSAETLDMKLNNRLKEASGIKMSAPLTLLVTGTMASPSVKLDIKSVMEQPAVKKAVDNAVKQGSKLLKGLFKK